MLETLFNVTTPVGQAAVVTITLALTVGFVLLYVISIAREFDKGQDSAGANGGGSESHGGRSYGQRDELGGTHNPGSNSSFEGGHYHDEQHSAHQSSGGGWGGGGGSERKSNSSNMGEYKNDVDGHDAHKRELTEKFNRLQKQFDIAKEEGDLDKALSINREMKEVKKELDFLVDKQNALKDTLKQASNQ